MIKPTAGPTDRSRVTQPDANRRDRDDPDERSRFDLELAGHSAPLRSRAHDADHPSKGDHHKPDDDDPQPNAALVQAPHDPRAVALHRAAPASDAPLTLGDAIANGLAAQPGAGQPDADPTAALAAPDPNAAATKAAAAAALASETIALSQSAEAAIDAHFAAVLARGEAVAAAGTGDSPLALNLDKAALDAALGDDTDGDGPDGAKSDHHHDALHAFDLRLLRAPEPITPHVHPLDAARPIAEQVADAVHKLAVEVVDRPDVLRFRAADFSFSAVVRHDGGVSQVRLVADDPNARAFLGERLPEVRQALARVGFPQTGLSVAADADRHHQSGQHDPRSRPDEPDEPRAVRPVAGAPTAVRPTAPRAGRPSSGVDLVL